MVRPGGFFAEEKRDTVTTTSRVADGVPLFTLTNTCTQNRFVIEKQIIADPLHDCVLQQIRLIPGQGRHRPAAVRAARPASGQWRAPITPAGSATIRARKCCSRSGDGTSLAFGLFHRVRGAQRRLRGLFRRLADFTAARHARRNLRPCRRWQHRLGRRDRRTTAPVLLAIGFGRTPEMAAFQAAASLARGYERAEAEYVANWRNWQNGLEPLDPLYQPAPHNFYRVSTGHPALP